MILLQAPQHGLAVGDVQVVRAVVADEHEAFIEVDRVELGEASPDLKPIKDQHGDTRLDIEFAAHRESGSGKQ